MNDFPVKQEIYVLLPSLTGYILPSGCPEKAPGLLPYLLLSSFLSGHIKVHYKHKNVIKCQAFNLNIMPFAPGFCTVIDHPCFVGGGASAKMPMSSGLGVELEPNFTHLVPTQRPCLHPLLSSCPQLLTITASTLQLYKIPSEMLNHLKRKMIILHLCNDSCCITNLKSTKVLKALFLLYFLPVCL